jgi:uncharacterized protein (DUF302 family)
MSYYFSKKTNYDFDTAIEKITEELKKQGFGILTEIDVKATLKKKLDVEFRNYRILGACSPPNAYKVLKSEPNIGILLPCNTVIQESEDGSVEVSVVNPLVAMGAIGNPDVTETAKEITERLKAALNAL